MSASARTSFSPRKESFETNNNTGIVVIASEAKQSMVPQRKDGLLRRVAPLRKRFAFVAGKDEQQG
jgi:hypothetical protein